MRSKQRRRLLRSLQNRILCRMECGKCALWGAGCSSMTGFHRRLSKIFLIHIVSRPHNIKFLDHQAIVLDNGPYNPKTGFRAKPISRWIDLEHTPRAGIQTPKIAAIFLLGVVLIGATFLIQQYTRIRVGLFRVQMANVRYNNPTMKYGNRI